MRVLFLQQQPCIRTLKYADGLNNEYPEITLMFAYLGKTLTELYGYGDELFDAWFPLGDDPAPRLREIITTHAIDLIHSHNAPDTLTNLCIDLFGSKISIVHDIHDLLSIRKTSYEDGFANEQSPEHWQEGERRAIEHSNAVITVSDEIVNIARQRYSLPRLTYVFPNYVPCRLIPAHVPPAQEIQSSRPLRIVYEGFLSNNRGHYDLTDIFRAVANEGIEIHFYPSRDAPSYRALEDESPNIFCHSHHSPAELLTEMVQYDFGWAGFNDSMNKAHLDTVMPNKLFEYLACGLPVISFPHKSLQRILEQYRLGIVVDQIAGLETKLRAPTATAIRANVLAHRYDFTMEANIGQLVNIYRQLCDDI